MLFTVGWAVKSVTAILSVQKWVESFNEALIFITWNQNYLNIYFFVQFKILPSVYDAKLY